MTYIFLILNLFIILIPFALMLDRKVTILDKLKTIIISSLIVTFVFSGLSVYLTNLKAWTFNGSFLIGLSYGGFPVEGYLFIFSFSFAGLGAYAYLNAKFPKNDMQRYSLAVSHLFIGICIAFLFFGYTKSYTIITFISLLTLLIGVEYINTLRFMFRFYRAFLIMLIPFYITYGIICNLPVVVYNDQKNVGFSLAKIPFENHFFMMAIMLLSVYLFEVLKNRKRA